MNSDQNFLPDPVFLPPLHFRNERAYDRRKFSLPSLQGDFVAPSTRRKLSLPWMKEENGISSLPESPTNVSSGIRISARDLSSLSNNSKVETTSCPHGPLKREYSLPGQPHEEPSIESTNGESVSLHSGRSKKSFSAGQKRPSTASGSNDNSNVATTDKWQEVLRTLASDSEQKDEESKLKTTQSIHEIDDTNSQSARRGSITQQPKFTASQLFSGDALPQLARRLPSLLPGSSDALTMLPSGLGRRLSMGGDGVTPKDVSLNVSRRDSVAISRDSPTRRPLGARDSVSQEHRSSLDMLLPNQREPPQVMCPHCGEHFPAPAELTKNQSSGCSGTMANICTYVAMAGVVLIGCVQWAQNGGTSHSQAPGRDLRSFFPTRRTSH